MRSTPYSGVVTLADLVRARLFIEDRLIIPLYVNLLTEQHVFARKLRSYGAHYDPYVLPNYYYYYCYYHTRVNGANLSYPFFSYP